MAMQQRRSEIVQAAYALVAEAGLERLRTRDVAARAGVNIATLHYYWPTKEALIAAVAQHLVVQFGAAYAAGAVPRGASPKERMAGEFANALVYLTERNDIVVVMQEMLLRARRDPQVARIVPPVLDAWRAAIERTIAAGVATGEFSSDIDPVTASGLVTSTITGALFSNVDAAGLVRIVTGLDVWLARRA